MLTRVYQALLPKDLTNKSCSPIELYKSLLCRLSVFVVLKFQVSGRGRGREIEKEEMKYPICAGGHGGGDVIYSTHQPSLSGVSVFNTVWFWDSSFFAPAMVSHSTRALSYIMTQPVMFTMRNIQMCTCRYCVPVDILYCIR